MKLMKLPLLLSCLSLTVLPNYVSAFTRARKEPSLRIGECIRFTEEDPKEPAVVRKVIEIHDTYYETYAHVNGHWYTKFDISSPVNFDVMEWMEIVPCPL